MTEVNVPLLRKAVEWAEAEAAKPYELCEWVQKYYISPSHHDIVSDDFYEGVNAFWGLEKAPECGTAFCIAGYVAYVSEGNMEYGRASKIARRALGLTSTQAGSLFWASNTVEDVRRIAESIAGEKL